MKILTWRYFLIRTGIQKRDKLIQIQICKKS